MSYYEQIVEEFLYESGLIKSSFVDYNAVRDMVKGFLEAMEDVCVEEGCVDKSDIEGVDAAGLLAFAVWNYWYNKTGEALDMSALRRVVEDVVPSYVIEAVQEVLEEER